MVADAQGKMKMYAVKVHQVGDETIVACCDADLLGRRLKDGELDLHVSERFYGGDIVDEDEMLKLLVRASSANILGDRAVASAASRGIIGSEGIMEVCGVKHAQLFLL